MTILHLATDADHADVVHAAVPGDTVAVCGHPLTEVLDTEWAVGPDEHACERCQHAVTVLTAVSAV